LLHSYANPSHEERIAARVSEAFPACHVTVSSSLLREFREYERTTTCLVNAVVAKPMGAYIKRLQDALKEHQLRIMSSSGGTVSPSFVQSNPVVTMLSGPAGGVVGAFAQACQAGEDRILTVDMGGTSTDVGLCHGALARTNESEIADLPVRLLTMDIATVGAGGGSIAWVDTGGALRVGPESMGANPGPAAYGKQDPPYTPTVTDAHVVLGHLHEGARLAGSMSLDVEAARRAVSTLGRQLGLSMEEVADGILRVAEANMARAVQKVTMQKGHDPRDSVLVPFGGAGGLHACRLASLLGMKKVWLPLFPGLLSATGMLLAPLVLDLSQSTMLRIRRDDFGVYPEPSLLPAVQTIQKALKVRADKQLLHESGWEGELTFSFEVGLRYAGQSYEMTVPLLESGTVAAFERKHEALYGYVAKERDLELVVVRFSVRSLTGEFPASTTSSSLEKSHLSPMDRVPMFVDGKWEEGVVLTRDALRDGNVLMGPALLSEYSATTLVPRGWFARVMPTGQVLISGE
jgi:N-methylhydantoinase A